MDFKDFIKRDSELHLSSDVQRLLATAKLSEKQRIEMELRAFQRLFTRFINESETVIDWNNIKKLPQESVRKYDTLEAPEKKTEMRTMLNKLVVVKLNGGLGTSMGCQGPKSIIPVRSGLTFLDLAVQQIEYLNKTYNSNVPLVLMNSFNTGDDTQKICKKYQGLQVSIYTFNQWKFPRISKETLMPIATSCDPDAADIEHWYPPGHGDFYEAFKHSGLLEEFIAQGKEYVFISNIDNLGATVDLSILNFLLKEKVSKCEFLMEVTNKTRADVKGGTLMEYDNKLRLLEIAQVPPEHVDDFISVKKFNIFNTNNLWIQLNAIDRVVREKKLSMEIIVNNKTLANGQNIIQLEQAVGAAIKCFDGSMGVVVPRSRFLPVKKTDDLLLIMSNLYSLHNGTLSMSSLRTFPSTPLIKLGKHNFGKVKEFLKRFGSIPDVLELDHLTVSGDVTFGKEVSLKGTVIIIANHGERIDIPPGAILENKIVSGNLRILDH